MDVKTYLLGKSSKYDGGDLVSYFLGKQSSGGSGRLPKEYQEVEYIESTGTQYIDTDYIASSNNLKLEIKFNQKRGGDPLFGCYVNTPYYQTTITLHGRNIYLSNYEPTGIKYVYNTVNEMVIEVNGNDNKTGTYKITNNNVQLGAGNSVGSICKTIKNYIFTQGSPSGIDTAKSSAVLYYLKFYDNNILVRNFVPCYRKNDGVIGLYDLVNNKFYANNGTGTFIKGSDVNYTYTTFSGTSLSISNSLKAKIKNFELLGNTEQDGTPSPSNPVDINVVTGENNVKVENKNLFDITNFESQLVSGKILNDSGVEVNDSTSTYSKYMIFLKGNQEYYIKGAFQRIYYYDENKNFVSRSTPSNNGISKTYKPTQDEYIGFQIINTYWQSNKGEEQVEIGTIATEYIEHQEQNYPITLNDIELCKIGDYQDRIFQNKIGSPYYDSTLDENEWYLHKEIGKVVLDGSEGYTCEGLYTNTARIDGNRLIGAKAMNENKILCNYFTSIYGDTSDTEHCRNGNSLFPNLIIFYINKSRIGNPTAASDAIENFKNWLSTHNTKVYYPLATPTNTKITEEDYPLLYSQLKAIENAKSYNGQTNITQTNDDLPFNISVDVLIKGE